MFCKNCGAQLSDEAKFCNSCGTSLDKSMHTNNNVGQIDKKRKQPVGMVIIIVAIVAIIALFSGGSGYEKTVDNFVEGMLEADAELFVSTLSNSYIDEQLEYNGYYSEAMLIQTYQVWFDDLTDRCVDKYGEKWKYDYEIIDCNEYGDEVNVTIRIELNGQNDGEFNIWNLSLVKNNGKWYVDNFS